MAVVTKVYLIIGYDTSLVCSISDLSWSGYNSVVKDEAYGIEKISLLVVGQPY